MDSHYTYAPVYAPTQPPEHRHTSTPTSLGYSTGPNPATYAATSTLPPISHSYSLPYPGEQSAHGNQTSQAPYAPNAVSGSHSVPYPAYAPQYSGQYNTTNAYSHTPRSFPTNQSYQQLGSNGTTSPAYSSGGAYAGRLADIRPMPTGALNERSSISSLPRLSSQRSVIQRSTSEDIEPTHVVGSQGRRGILPSASGRPVAVTDPNESKGPNAGLKKDPSDGKWPCEHCNKRYLHAKHLKRHLLRHTGTRPYSCGLCRETFSRSDILKRHFMKCSIRRGNPTGANHLTHSRATRKLKLEQSQEESLNTAHSSAFGNSSSHSGDFSFTSLSNLSSLSDPDLRTSSYDRDQISRASSVKRTTQGTVSSNKGNHSAPNSASLDGSGFYSAGQATPDSLTTSGAATPFNYSNDPRSNQLSPNTTINSSMNGLSLDLNSLSRSLANPNYSSGTLPHIVEGSRDRSGDFDWSSLQSLDANEEYTTSQYHSQTAGHHQHIKPDPGNYHSGAFSINQKYNPYQAAKQ